MGKICKFCGNEFAPSKYRPNQEVCSEKECQYKRQLKNMGKWRDNNPDYFKYGENDNHGKKERSQKARGRARDWREKNKEYLTLYREQNKDRHKKYMKEYMKEYRAGQKKSTKKKVNNQYHDKAENKKAETTIGKKENSENKINILEQIIFGGRNEDGKQNLSEGTAVKNHKNTDVAGIAAGWRSRENRKIGDKSKGSEIVLQFLKNKGESATMDEISEHMHISGFKSKTFYDWSNGLVAAGLAEEVTKDGKKAYIAVVRRN
jgi:hypothetical protein